MAKGSKRTDTEARPEATEHPEVEQAARLRLAGDVPDPKSAATDHIADATADDTPGAKEIDSRFANEDIEFGDALAEAVDEAGAEEDPLAAQFGIDFGQPVTGRERLADMVSGLEDDTSQQQPDGRYGKEMIMGDAGGSGGTGGGGEIVSGHPLAYGVQWKDGEVTGHYAASPVDDDGMFLGVDVGAMAYEREMTKKAEEVAANRNTGSGTPTGSGSGPGTGTGSGTGTGAGSGPTTTNNPDGSITTQYSDGTTIVTQPDGSQAVINPDGSVDYYKPDGSFDHHEDPPPKEDPPEEDTPKEDPPKDDKPKEDPPKEDPPKEDPPKADGGGTESTPDEDYVDPEVEALLRAELAQDPQLAAYEASKQNDGVTDPVDDAVGTPLVKAGEVPDLRQRGLDMFGQPPDDAHPDRDVPSNSGYWDDPNHGAIDPADDQDVAGGPQRNDDPLDTGNRIEPPAATGGEEEDAAADDGAAVFIPPYDELTLVEERPDLPDPVLDP